MGSCHTLGLFFKKYVVKHLSRRLFLLLFFGQGLSLLLCLMGTISQELVISFKIKVPVFQGFLHYCLLTAIFTTQLAYDWREFMNILKDRWWKYLILAFIEVEAQFMVFTAYQYTSLTSVQLLDCLSIPVVVILSLVALKAKYRPIHYFGIFICVGGMGFLVWADIYGSRDQGPKAGNHSELIGDLLVIGGSCLYGIGNVAQEFVVKTARITEYLGMVSLFAIFISAANLISLETHAVYIISWNYKVILLFVSSTLAMFIFNILICLLIRHSSATVVNLTLLTADLYSLFVGLYLFNYTFSHLYILSFVIIVIGVIIFKVFPTPSRVDGVLAPSSSAMNYSCDSDEEILPETV